MDPDTFVGLWMAKRKYVSSKKKKIRYFIRMFEHILYI
jgi:hypothetical protein